VSPALIRLAALMRKEMLQIRRDPSSILIALVLPVILLFLFGFAVSLDAGKSRIGLVVEAPSAVAGSLAGAFDASPYFAVTRARDSRALRDRLGDGDLKGIVVIPADFARVLAAGTGPRLQVIVDGSDANTAHLVQNYVQGTVQNWAAIRGGGAPAIALVPRFWFNPDLASRNFLVPGSIVIVMTLVGTLLTALVVAREWERGTMEAMMATPVTGAELLLGKTLPYFALAMASMTLCVGIAVLGFGVPFRGSIWALYLMAAVFLLPALGQGLVISALTRNQFLAAQIALVSAFLPAFLLSGFVFEIGSMPAPIRWLSQVLPARHLIPGLQTVFLAGDFWPLFLRGIAALLAIGAVLALVALRGTRKRLD